MKSLVRLALELIIVIIQLTFFFNIISVCNCHNDQFLSFKFDNGFKHRDFEVAFVVQNPSKINQRVVIQFLWSYNFCNRSYLNIEMCVLNIQL